MHQQAAMNSPTLADVFHAYRHHPEFLGITIEDVNQRGAMDSTLLHIASRTARLEHMRVLMGAGALVNALGDLGNTPLHEAAMAGKADAVELLLSSGADPRVKNEFDQSALEVARLGGHSQVVEVLQKPGGAKRTQR